MPLTAPLARRATRSWFVEQIADDGALREAWWRVQRGAKTAGVDGMTVDVFRAQLDRRLAQLGRSLAEDQYCPSPVKRVQIPKPGGGWRMLGIPTIVDRIVQTSAALALHLRVAALFSDRSFAYRPFLGPKRAALALRQRLTSGAWVVTADIEKFFDNVDHRILADQLRVVGVDDHGVSLILGWLGAPVQDRGRRLQAIKGLPQGSPVAPILANLYLTGFDTALQAEGFEHVRYADDFVIVADSQGDANRALAHVTAFLESRLKLRVKPAKTQLAEASSGFTFVGFRFTPDTWTVPHEAILRFKAHFPPILAETERLAEAAKAHNDLVRGWRHYYAGNSIEMDQQLSQLDEWRLLQCRAHLQQRGHDPEGAAVWFERLTDERGHVVPQGTYAHHEETGAPEDPAATNVVDQWHEGIADGRDAGTFSSRQQLHDAVIGDRQPPVVMDGRRLRIPVFGAFVSKSRNLVVIRRKKQIIFECPLSDVSHITVEAEGVAVSTTLLDECARRRIVVTLCRASGRPFARVLPARSPLTTALVLQQVRARATRFGTELVRSLLIAKCKNQRALLLYHGKYKARQSSVRDALATAASNIDKVITEIEQRPSAPLRVARPMLFLAEARAAAWYWSAIAELVPASLGFVGRSPRPAADVVNKALNYGYALLLSEVWIAVHRAGFEPTLGLLHSGRRRSAGLVYDLMEPFRQPIVDRAVLGLLGRRARLEVNVKGDLTMRTRSLLQQAIKRHFGKKAHRSHSSAPNIHRSVLNFRRALVDRRVYDAYRMTW